MSDDLLRRVEEVFLAVAEMEPAARAAAVRERCAGDEVLLREVEELLSHLDGASSFLDPEQLRERAALDDPPLPVNARIGDYTILGVLGTGGMGVVYIAQQERPRRTVALKLIRASMASRNMLRRFEHEAELLGRLQHPGIAQIFEAGVATPEQTGLRTPQPYIAMELVEGLPLLDYAKARGLDPRERLELLARAAEAVQHAHQRGIIHRDLKPGNILVDAHGQPKVLDFGVARASEGSPHLTSVQTSVGQIIGTLPYMSPEQVLADPNEIDVRSDVYSLGVILYQLLTDRLPHEVKGRSLAEAARLIRDELPVRLGAIDRSLRGDVETIVAKALEKDRERRYQSAADLAEDIRRHLSGLPIAAKNDSALYVLRKQIRRYRGVAAAALLFVTGLGALAVFATLKARSELAERKRADETAARLASELSFSNVERARLLGVSGNMVAAEDLAWPEFIENPDSKLAHWALRELYASNPCVAATPATTIEWEGPAQRVMAALSADGRVGALMSVRGLLRTFEVPSLRPGIELTNEPLLYAAVAMSPNGESVLLGRRDGKIDVVGIAEGRVLATLEGHVGVVRAIAHSPDGATLYTAGQDRTVLAHAAGLSPRTVFTAPVQVGALAASRDGTRLAVVCANGDVEIIEIETGGVIDTLKVRGVGLNASAAFGPDDRLFACTIDRTLAVWSFEERRWLRSFPTDNGGLGSIAFEPSGGRVVTAGWWRVDLWRLPGGSLEQSQTSHDAFTRFAGFTPDGMYLVTAAEDGSVRAWETGPDRWLRRFAEPGEPAWVFNVACSPDGSLVAAASIDGHVRLWNAATGELTARLEGHTGRVRDVRFTPDGTMLLSGGRERDLARTAIRLWDTATGSLLRSVEAHRNEIESLDISRDGTLLVSASDDGTVKLWSLPDLSPVAELKQEGAVSSARFSPDGSRIAVCSDSPTVLVFDTRTHERVAAFTCERRAWCAYFDPTGTRLAVGTWARSVEVWPLAGGEPLRLRGHVQLVPSAVFSPDGSLIASASDDATVKIWDATTGRRLATLQGHAGQVSSVCFSPDGGTVFSGSADGSVGVWSLGYFDRHIAGNLEYQLERQRGRVRMRHAGRLNAWARGILSAPGAVDSAGR